MKYLEAFFGILASLLLKRITGEHYYRPPLSEKEYLDD